MALLKPGDWERFGAKSPSEKHTQQWWAARTARIAGFGALPAELSLQLARMGIGRIELGLEGCVREADFGGTSLYASDDHGQPCQDAAYHRLLGLQPRCDVRRGATHAGEKHLSVLPWSRTSAGPRGSVGTAFAREVRTGAMALLVCGPFGCPACPGLNSMGTSESEVLPTGLRGLALTELCIRLIAEFGRLESDREPKATVLGVDCSTGEPLVQRDALVLAGCEMCLPRKDLQAALPRTGDPIISMPSTMAGEVEPESTEALLHRGVRLVDVREMHEADIVAIPGSELVPLQNLEAACESWDRSQGVLLYCKTGVRSRRALELLRRKGFREVAHLRGGVLAWIDAVAPDLPRY